MPDREKVIRAWECCNPFNRKCNECPYEKDCYHDGISRHMVADAIAMLKEQEAVEPSFKQDEKGIFVWCCGSCGAYLYHIYEGIDKAKEYAKFCRQCGKPILWESR